MSYTLHMDKYLEDRLNCLLEERVNLINSFRIALMLCPPEAKECKNYLTKVIERSEDNDACD